MVPASLMTRVAQLGPLLERVLDFLHKRLEADLSDVNVVNITGRLKTEASIFQKLQTGKYDDLSDLTDLVALTIVVLYRKDIQGALDIVKGSGLVVIGEPARAIEATDFRYREPKLFVTPPIDYLDRNPDLQGIVAEVQFTTAIQHALDMTTHDFDYKGHSYSWSNFRLVAQLRGMLELVDSMIDDIGSVSISNHETVEAPPELIYAVGILDVLDARFTEEAVPADRRRFADTVAKWTSALGISAQELGALLDAHADLLNAQSIDATSAVLGALLRERGTDLLTAYDGRLCISAELDSLCHEAGAVPAERRVQL